MASFLGFMVLGFYPWVSFHKVENLHSPFHFDGGVFSLGAHILSSWLISFFSSFGCSIYFCCEIVQR